MSPPASKALVGVPKSATRSLSPAKEARRRHIKEIDIFEIIKASRLCMTPREAGPELSLLLEEHGPHRMHPHKATNIYIFLRTPSLSTEEFE